MLATPRSSQFARRCDPSRVGTALAPSTGGVAPLNHRLIALTPPGSLPLVEIRIPRKGPKERDSAQHLLLAQRRDPRLIPHMAHVDPLGEEPAQGLLVLVLAERYQHR